MKNGKPITKKKTKPLDPICEQWAEYHSVTGDSVAAALLVLAYSIENKHMIDRSSAELLGHEFSLALQAAPINIKTEVQNG